MGDVASWMARQKRREDVQPAALFYYRASGDGGIEQVCAANHETITKRITRKQAIETANQLLKLALQGWTE